MAKTFPGLGYKARRMVPFGLGLFATARRHKNWLRSASGRLSQFFREACLNRAKKMKGLEPHPWSVAQHTDQSLMLEWGVCMCVGGEDPFGMCPR
jgi:hypothetical protein